MDRRSFLSRALGATVGAALASVIPKKKALTFEKVQEAVKRDVEEPLDSHYFHVQAHQDAIDKEIERANLKLRRKIEEDLFEPNQDVLNTGAWCGNFDGFLKKYYGKLIQDSVPEHFLLKDIGALD